MVVGLDVDEERWTLLGAVNELKLVYAAMGIDIWESYRSGQNQAVSGFMAFYPGPGLGGHCIPIDPFHLTWKCARVRAATRVLSSWRANQHRSPSTLCTE